ncbi:hypothetical protein [Halobacterium salinarum]|uniref:hypothetical protein n=1 Tax=Halobacterium salinarum TaxID=2242 RepID=UPI002554FD28|nr:hypothetical protein [Halobacterium salinarum]MDL0134971.1 hypothetical protein [Halobacterium salinarum]
MTDNVSRLGEAQKQIRIVAERLEDPELVEDLEDAEVLLETVEGKIADRSGET